MINIFNRKKAKARQSDYSANEAVLIETLLEIEKIDEEDLGQDSEQIFYIHENIKNSKEMMDLVVAVEQIARQFQHSKHRYDELENRAKHQAYQLDEQQKENLRLALLVEGKEKTIDHLEKKIADNNLKLDQFMEEYSELKTQLTSQIDEMKNVVNIERRKFINLNEQYEKDIVEWVNNVKKKDDQILKLESENSNLQERNEQTMKENKFLLKTVNDFTNRMSNTFIDLEEN